MTLKCPDCGCSALKPVGDLNGEGRLECPDCGFILPKGWPWIERYVDDDD
jgi:DNA-directed RNA polymerase subunit RPC12/RpoP